LCPLLLCEYSKSYSKGTLIPITVCSSVYDSIKKNTKIYDKVNLLVSI